MVNVVKGILVTCDPPMRHFLLHLDETQTFGFRFVLQDLDETHLFVSEEALPLIQSKVDELLDKMALPLNEMDGK
ncbi:unnamed protein product [Cyprideis torosa]|uniref:General transcription and DNA repair factor IIH subunit TFB5 n=1 Tax=Cyprideis torosa TaxID=163714 RepID=A0A7R8ZNQ0_9CRUS|nr:unnamed protein product [Cyprideis torosa]CAG0898506.1 unnamed protein product [Cyprideis torosa]